MPTVRVRYFAALRERLGRTEEQFELDALPAASVAGVFEHLVSREPSLSRLRAHLRAAVNQDFVPFETQLQGGDEVAFIPPVSGGSGGIEELRSDDGRFMMTTRPLDTMAVAERVRRAQAGAVLIFEGVVRDHTGERQVDHLEYEAYLEMALSKLMETAGEAGQRWPACLVAIHHRHGRLTIGEAAVIIAVSSPHRAEAYACSQYVIDRLKEVVPIWKKEVSPDGDVWVGLGP